MGLSDKAEEYTVVFMSYFFLNYIVPYFSDKFFRVTAKTYLWGQKEFEDIEEELEECSLELKVQFDKLFTIKNRRDIQWYNKIPDYLNKKYLERNILYLIQKRNNLVNTRKTLKFIIDNKQNEKEIGSNDLEKSLVETKVIDQNSVKDYINRLMNK